MKPRFFILRDNSHGDVSKEQLLDLKKKGDLHEGDIIVKSTSVYKIATQSTLGMVKVDY